MNHLVRLSLRELVARLQRRDVSCREVVAAHLNRIDEVNASVRAVTEVLGASALEAADRADSAGQRGPLHGVPFTIKESVDVVGSATTQGVRSFAQAFPYVDAPAVARLRAAGAIPLARTNMSELGMRVCTDNPLRGRTYNPWNRAVTVGGSSGGDAAAVATGMTPLGLGTDLGGSLRIPAHVCGVAALKPTTGRVPHASSLEPQDPGLAGQLMATPGPVARSVADLELVLRAISGRDPRDPRSVDVPLVGPARERRAALVLELPGAPVPPAVRDAVKRAGALLEAAGWDVEEAVPPEVDRVCEAWHKVVAVDVTAFLPLVRPVISAELAAHLERLCAGASLEGTTMLRLHAERSRLARAWSGFFTEYAVVVGPNLAAEPWAPDADLDAATGLDMLRTATRFILPANALGFPALALPAGMDRGIPVGIQVCADLWREDLCFAAATVVEAGMPPVAPVEPGVASSSS